LPLLAQERQENYVAFANRSWCKQAEVAHIVPVTIRDLICKTRNELAGGVSGGDCPVQFLIFGQKTDLLLSAGEQTVIG